MNAKIPAWLTALLIVALVLICIVGYESLKEQHRTWEREECKMAGNDCSPW